MEDDICSVLFDESVDPTKVACDGRKRSARGGGQASVGVGLTSDVGDAEDATTWRVDGVGHVHLGRHRELPAARKGHGGKGVEGLVLVHAASYSDHHTPNSDPPWLGPHTMGLLSIIRKNRYREKEMRLLFL